MSESYGQNTRVAQLALDGCSSCGYSSCGCSSCGCSSSWAGHLSIWSSNYPVAPASISAKPSTTEVPCLSLAAYRNAHQAGPR
ncbi:GD12227 [Drosophila simulans]|uniref:GD12227 n=1 Tax=Drosophila simulans TaxID=7240 RepID=B4QRF7_DROSI|nr:GD12227 [Drosophila simulans]